jgi:hypothetical protein
MITLQTALTALASVCHQLSVNQTALAQVIAKDIDCVNPVSQQVAQGVIDHNEQLRQLLKDIGGMIATIS